MGFMKSLLCLPMFVLIFVFDSVIIAKGGNVHTSLTKRKHTWSQARKKCSLIRNEHTNITFPTAISDLMWTDDSGKYSTWVEYLGCFELKEDRQLVINETDVEAGNQLKDCLLHCKEYNFIGLQQSNCVCLHNLLLTTKYIWNPCNTYPEKCDGDQDAFCGKKSSNWDAFSIYQTVHVTGKVGVGNCLVVRNNDSYKYIARNCSATAFQICLKESALSKSFYQQKVMSGTWIDSFQLCEGSYMLLRYSLVAYNSSFSKGTYWLSNTGRWIQGTFTNPEFCIAARLNKDGSLQRFPLRCDRKLPGLCVGREWTPKHVLSSDVHAPINKVLLISVIAATGFIFLMTTVIVILCKRRTSTRTDERQPTLVSQNGVLYENELNILSRNQTVNDTIDHMHYQSLNQNRNQIDSNYDILQNAEVDVTSNRQPQRVIGETAGQRQTEADYQEIEDVSI